jgi:hypothetical protein
MAVPARRGSAGICAATRRRVIGLKDPVTPPEANPATESAAAGPSGLVGQIVAGRYRIERLLGTGGMGSVYQAEHVHMRKLVALKVLHRELTYLPELVARFEREAVAAAQIEHPNVAAATDFGRLEDGSFYLVLEYVEGRNLHTVLRAEGPLPAERALEIGRQIAMALGAAHARGIVHRDLKPENVMLVDRAQERDRVKVLDFGVAKLVRDDGERALTQIGAIVGTPEYMSPEQVLGQSVDHRTDLYSLGIVLYEMLTAKRPFSADEPAAVLAQQMSVPPPPLGPSVDPATATLVMRLLAKQSDERLQTSDDVVRAMDRIAAARKRAILAAEPGRGDAERALQGIGSRFVRVLVAMRQPFRLGSRTVPRWVPIAVGAAALLVGVVMLGSGPKRGSPPALRSAPRAESSSGERPAPPRATTSAALEAASKRVEDIEALPIYRRRPEDWLALGHAQAELGHYRESVAAYRSVLSVRPGFREDPELLTNLRRAGRDPEAFRIVVNLCETILGRTGLDLLYLIWLDVLHEHGDEAMADTLLKKLEIMRLRASPALRIAIELELAKSCGKMRDVVIRALDSADQRSVERLGQLEHRLGCGPRLADDCWPCLRGDDLLAQALDRARSRPAPKLGRAE